MSEPIRLITTKFQSFIADFFLLIPNLVAAVGFLIIAWLCAWLVKRTISRVASSRGRHDLGNLLGGLARGAVLLLAILFAAAIVFPSVNPGGVFATLGVGSVAIGFAFKDILQNLLAGLLLLINRPYKRGDQIKVKDFEGTVEHIESRATLIKTYDGRRVIIPNSDVYTSPVVVNTAFDKRRDDYVIGIGYGDDPEATAATFLAAIAAVDGVLAEPPPEVLPWALNNSTVDLKARWWVRSQRTELVRTRARVILAIYARGGPPEQGPQKLEGRQGPATPARFRRATRENRQTVQTRGPSKWMQQDTSPRLIRPTLQIKNLQLIWEG